MKKYISKVILLIGISILWTNVFATVLDSDFEKNNKNNNVNVLYTDQNTISNLYIEHSGNNKYESEIIAHDIGMRRALLLLVDKLEIGKLNVDDISYYTLKELFSVIKIENEEIYDNLYRASVTYRYDLDRLYNLLIDYGDKNLQNKFNEYLVIPVFKQGSKIFIWDYDKYWDKIWKENKDYFAQNSLIYPSILPLQKNQIRSDNIYKFSYSDFITLFNKFLFKNVLIVTYELFTDRNTQNGYLLATMRIMDIDNKVSHSKIRYNLTNLRDFEELGKKLVDDIVYKYGVPNDNLTNDKDKKHSDIINAKKKYKKIKPHYVMLLEIFDPNEIDEILLKLRNIKNVNDIKIMHDYGRFYKILLYTDISEYMLAEQLYINDLTYSLDKNGVYNLVNIKPSAL